MAQRKIQVKFCDSCIKDVPATTTTSFSLSGVDYDIDLCEKHADALTRDFLRWARLARERERPSYFRKPEEIRDYTRRTTAPAPSRKAEPVVEEVQEVAAPAAVISPEMAALPATAKNWILTEHAKEQLKERGPIFGFTREDVFLCAAEPEICHHGHTAKGDRWQYFRGDLQLIVDPESKTIITVMPKDSSLLDMTNLKELADATR